MYILTKNILDKLKSDSVTRMQIAMRMGVQEQAVIKNMKEAEGRSIANNYDAMNYLIHSLKLKESEIRTPIEEPVTA